MKCCKNTRAYTLKSLKKQMVDDCFEGSVAMAGVAVGRVGSKPLFHPTPIHGPARTKPNSRARPTNRRFCPPAARRIRQPTALLRNFGADHTPQGMLGFAFFNGGMSSNQSGEDNIRKAIIEIDHVDCIVAHPDQLFYSTQHPDCLRILAKTKADDGKFHYSDGLGCENQMAPDA